MAFAWAAKGHMLMDMGWVADHIFYLKTYLNLSSHWMLLICWIHLAGMDYLGKCYLKSVHGGNMEWVSWFVNLANHLALIWLGLAT